MPRSPRYRLLILILFIGLNVIGQTSARRICGIVKDINDNPVSFCLVQALGSSEFIYSDDNGNFCIERVAERVNKLVFFCAGYDKYEVAVTGDSAFVQLQPLKRTLKEVTVTASRNGKWKVATLGRKNVKPSGMATGQYGNESAIFLPADSSRNGILQEVCYYIVDGGKPDARFRVHIYDMDSASMPGADLLDSNVILHGTKEGNDWVCVDLTTQHIHVGRGIFVSIEWIEGQISATLNDKQKPEFQGAVLGHTESNPNQWSGYERGKLNTTWVFWPLPSGGKNPINHMIYGIYTYQVR